MIKHKKTYFLLGLFITICLVACNNEEPDFIGAQAIINSYLYDNYELGDTLLFRKENNETDTFVVTHNRSVVHVVRHENWHKMQMTYDSLWTEAILLISNGELTLEVGMMQAKDSTVSRIDIYTDTPRNENIIMNHTISNKMPIDFEITNSIGQSVHLRRGEGIIDFSDGEHTWMKSYK